MIRIKLGDEQAFRFIYGKYRIKILNYSYRFLKDEAVAEEIVQECFLVFWEMRQRLDENLPAGPLLYTIARRLALNEIRKIANSRNAIEALWNRISYSDESTEEMIYAKDLEKVSHEALEILSPQQQKVFYLSRHEGKSHKEISNLLNISTNTVNCHLVESLKKIRLYFQKYDVLILFFLLFKIMR